MLLFHRIDDAQAIVRVKGGVYRQTEVYRRGERIFVKHGSGFLRVTAKFGETWGTSASGVNVIDISEVPGMEVADPRREPYLTGDQGASS